MKINILSLERLEHRFDQYSKIESASSVKEGWIQMIRSGLNISLKQLGKKMKISPQSVKELEIREKNGSATLKALRNFAESLNLKLVYGFVPNGKTLSEMIDERAQKLAKEIVERSAQTMFLENQLNASFNLEKSIQLKKEEIKLRMPSILWD